MLLAGMMLGVALAWGMWHAGGRWICGGMMAHYDRMQSTCYGGKLADDVYHVLPQEQWAAALAFVQSLGPLALLAALTFSLPAAVYYFGRPDRRQL